MALTDSELIDALGGTSAVARLFGIKPPSVSNWRTDGIPKSRLMYLQVAHPELFDEQVQAANDDNYQEGGDGAA